MPRRASTEPKPKPFSVWSYPVRRVDPLEVYPARHWSDHATASAAHTKAKAGVDGGLVYGPGNVTEVRGPTGVLGRYVMGTYVSTRSRSAQLSSAWRDFRGPLCVSGGPEHVLRYCVKGEAAEPPRVYERGPVPLHRRIEDWERSHDMSLRLWAHRPTGPTWAFYLVHDLTRPMSPHSLLGWSWVEPRGIQWEAAHASDGGFGPAGLDSLPTSAVLLEIATTLPDMLAAMYADEGAEMYTTFEQAQNSIYARRLSVPFKQGHTYTTREGNAVVIEKEYPLLGYEQVRGRDGICRYNRESDRGRVTGSAFDGSDKLNLVPETP